MATVAKSVMVGGSCVVVVIVMLYSFHQPSLDNKANIRLSEHHAIGSVDTDHAHLLSDTKLISRTRQDIIKQIYSQRSTDPSHVKAFPSLGCYIMDKYNQSLFQIDGLNFLCQPGFDVEKNMKIEDAEEIYYRYV